MTETRGPYSREVKLDALGLVETSAKSVRKIERDQGIGRGCLYRGQDEFEAADQGAFASQGRLTPEQEALRRMEAMLKDARGPPAPYRWQR
jgi:transposase